MNRIASQFEQADSASVWNFDFPAEHKFPHILGFYTADGMTELEADSFNINAGKLTVYFGVESHSGFVKYTYEAESGSTSTVTTDGNVVNITINQNPRV